ncbi:PP2C family serine/threonine-protein phosphatase [Aliikangiella sp. G2MR2-5]|uniref:PP2C family protein-serine/threonine phosphatase n=1 Tax=Aliikangiella sp. G2MR2-5 TaxID=2788943 RepID=UPI0018AB1B4D|nr:protein phosphatase 2C domain-containing protein [Aliikangiella sp. G2MR2-5]
MIFRAQAICEQGKVRPNNEDAIRYGSLENSDVAKGNLLWMAVADGMGGHKAGEVASCMFVQHAEQSLQKWLSNLHEQPKAQQSEQYLAKIIEEANSLIFEAARNNEEYLGMGTTGVLLVCWQNFVAFAWVGDSRLYRLRKNELQQLTEDHTMIQYLLNKGSISQEEARRSNTRHLLSRAVGVKANIEVDSGSTSLNTGDALLASTDGLHESLSDGEMAGFLAQAAMGYTVVEPMVRRAMAEGSRDNLTLGIISTLQETD